MSNSLPLSVSDERVGFAVPDENFEHRMSMRRGDLREFFAPEAASQQVLAERRRLIADFPHRHVALSPGAEDVLEEALELLGTPLNATSPQERLAELGGAVEPDVLLMKPDNKGQLRLAGGCLCFPSGWSLEEKMGMTMEEIHAVVPGLNEAAGKRIETFLNGMKPGKAWLRSNWGLSPTPDFNRHPDAKPVRFDAEFAAEDGWLRVEHQALAALPASKGILFGIRIVSHPLSQVSADPALREALRRQLETMPEDVVAYKGIAPVRKALQTVLKNGEDNPYS